MHKRSRYCCWPKHTSRPRANKDWCFCRSTSVHTVEHICELYTWIYKSLPSTSQIRRALSSAMHWGSFQTLASWRTAPAHLNSLATTKDNSILETNIDAIFTKPSSTTFRHFCLLKLNVASLMQQIRIEQYKGWSRQPELIPSLICGGICGVRLQNTSMLICVCSYTYLGIWQISLAHKISFRVYLIWKECCWLQSIAIIDSWYSRAKIYTFSEWDSTHIFMYCGTLVCGKCIWPGQISSKPSAGNCRKHKSK